ncbi:hypothetical protein IJL65_02490 [bacterium]|nr:hypothetical protein [bacterium]
MISISLAFGVYLLINDLTASHLASSETNIKSGFVRTNFSTKALSSDISVSSRKTNI